MTHRTKEHRTGTGDKNSKENIEIERLNEEILLLRAQIFKLRDELHVLRNSRVVGRIIKARDLIGSAIGIAVPIIISSPRRSIRFVKVNLAKVLPKFVRVPIMRVLRYDHRKHLIKIRTIKNTKIEDSLPLVSVVVPYYNRNDTIDDTINSLLSQTFRNFEVLIVDDGSPSELARKKLSLLETGDMKVSVIRQENKGVASARNNGVRVAKGRYIICLDSDDMLDPTFIEKNALVLESNPDISIVTSYMTTFGVTQERFEHVEYDPIGLFRNNMVITAAMFRKDAWLKAGGYKSGIGYEDWEYWLTLGEKGYWGKLIPEPLFQYRVAMQSRYVEDKDIHWNNLKAIRALHPRYKRNVRNILIKRQYKKNVIDAPSALINMVDKGDYLPPEPAQANILITIPWMTFGGAETLIYNYCREIKNDFNITFMTGLVSDHEWEYKFREISRDIYHLPNLFDDNKNLYVDFVSNYIKTREIDILHIIHNGFMFEMLPELKERNPNLKIVVTMFNDRVEDYVQKSIMFQDYVDIFSTDNNRVAESFKRLLTPQSSIVVIPNGINCYEEFNPMQFERKKQRDILGIPDQTCAVFFIGRLSEEKNPMVFLDAAEKVLSMEKSPLIKFFIIGDGPMKGLVEKKVKAISSDAVNYLGYQSEIAQYLNAADIFVLPSSIEGFPLSILEAMAMKVVVVASNVGAIPDIIDAGEDGFVIKPGSVDEIIRIVAKLSADQKTLDIMKQKARKKVENKYSSKVLGTNYRKLYARLKK